MIIAICVHNLANGGAERVAALWAEGFLSDGNEVHLITCEPDARVDYDISQSIFHHLIYCEGNPVKRYFGKIWQLRRLIQVIHPDVAIAVLHPWNRWLLLATCGLGVPVINTEHDSFERPNTAPMLMRTKVDKFILNRFFKGVTVLTSVDKRIAEKHIKKVFEMPNPLAFVPVKNLPSKKHIIIAAGRLDEWYCKGFDVLIKAWGRIARKFPDWKLQIAGGGKEPNVARVTGFVKDNDVVGQVELLGFRKDIVSLFKEASIFVLSSRYEGFGLVLIEAMSQGCACIACDYNGRQREIIRSDDEGLTCLPDDVTTLSEELERLINEKSSREMIQMNSIERAWYFSVDNTTKRWYEVFKQLKIIKTVQE